MNWVGWAKWYGEFFGLLGDRDADMIAAWIKDVFAPMGFTPADLHEAGLRIARSNPPTSREGHYSRLHEAARGVRTARLVKAAGEAAQDVDWSNCKDCGNSGLVVVPHVKPDHLSKVRGHRPTMFVICPCPVGAAFRAKTKPGFMTLEEYELAAPLWRDQLKEWEQSEQAFLRQLGRARDSDRRLGRLIKRIADGPQDQTQGRK